MIPTPKEKAKELVDKFFSNALPDAVECDLNIGKLCALIAVDEILKVAYWPTARQYWQEIKEEIEKL